MAFSERLLALAGHLVRTPQGPWVPRLLSYSGKVTPLNVTEKSLSSSNPAPRSKRIAGSDTQPTRPSKSTRSLYSQARQHTSSRVSSTQTPGARSGFCPRSQIPPGVRGRGAVAPAGLGVYAPHPGAVASPAAPTPTLVVHGALRTRESAEPGAPRASSSRSRALTARGAHPHPTSGVLEAVPATARGPGQTGQGVTRRRRKWPSLSFTSTCRALRCRVTMVSDGEDLPGLVSRF